MKFNSSIDINKPRSLVTKIFSNPLYNGNYQDGFLRKEHKSGDKGKDGAVANMYYLYGKRKMELTETIISNNLPDSFEAFYHHKHMDNTMKCSFIELDEKTTRYESEFEYTRVSWIMPRLMMILFPNMFKKQGEKWMQNFKLFVESLEE